MIILLHWTNDKNLKEIAGLIAKKIRVTGVPSKIPTSTKCPFKYGIKYQYGLLIWKVCMFVLFVHMLCTDRSYVSVSDEEQEYICVLEPTSLSISKYLVTPKPPSKTPVRQIKSYGHVMTSLEISDAIETRDKAKNKI